MKKKIFFFLLVVCSVFLSKYVIAQNSNHIYKIVYVKGKPLRFGKKEIHDGQQIQDKEMIMFTTLEDVVLLLNANYEKIRLFPARFNNLKKLIKVADYINAWFELNAHKTSITNTRGGKTQSFSIFS